MGKRTNQPKMGAGRRVRSGARAFLRKFVEPLGVCFGLPRAKMLSKVGAGVANRHSPRPSKPFVVVPVPQEAGVATPVAVQVGSLAVARSAPLLLTSSAHQLALEIVAETPKVVMCAPTTKCITLAIDFVRQALPAAAAPATRQLLLTYSAPLLLTDYAHWGEQEQPQALPSIPAAAVAPLLLTYTAPLLLTDFAHWEEQQEEQALPLPPIHEFLAAQAKLEDPFRGMGLSPAAVAGRVSAPAVPTEVQLASSLTSGSGLVETAASRIPLAPSIVSRGISAAPVAAATTAAAAVAVAANRVAPRTKTVASSTAAFNVQKARKTARILRLTSLRLEMQRAVSSPPHPSELGMLRQHPRFVAAACAATQRERVECWVADAAQLTAAGAFDAEQKSAQGVRSSTKSWKDSANAMSFRFGYHSVNPLPPGCYRPGALSSPDKAAWKRVGFACCVDDAFYFVSTLPAHLKAAHRVAVAVSTAKDKDMLASDLKTLWKDADAREAYREALPAIKELFFMRDFIERAAADHIVERARLGLPPCPVPLPEWVVKKAMDAMLTGRQALSACVAVLLAKGKKMVKADGDRLGYAAQLAYRHVQILHAALPEAYTACVSLRYALAMATADAWIDSMVWTPGKQLQIPYFMTIHATHVDSDGMDVRFPEFYALQTPVPAPESVSDGTSGRETPRSDEGSVLAVDVPVEAVMEGPAGGDASNGGEAPDEQPRRKRGKRGKGNKAKQLKPLDKEQQHADMMAQRQRVLDDLVALYGPAGADARFVDELKEALGAQHGKEEANKVWKLLMKWKQNQLQPSEAV